MISQRLSNYFTHRVNGRKQSLNASSTIQNIRLKKWQTRFNGGRSRAPPF